MSKQRNPAGTGNGKYEPKATVRHEKIAKSKKTRLQESKQKLIDDKHFAKKEEARRRKEIRELPRDERGPATERLKADIRKRKEAQAEAEARYWEEVEVHKGKPAEIRLPKLGALAKKTAEAPSSADIPAEAEEDTAAGGIGEADIPDEAEDAADPSEDGPSAAEAESPADDDPQD